MAERRPPRDPGEGKPYLESLPQGHWADLLVMEWLEFLVDEGGTQAAARALEYYERIGWIDEAVTEQLDRYLGGFEEEGDGTLSIDHHRRSLSYVDQLGDGDVSVERLL